MLYDVLFALRDYWEFAMREVGKREAYEWFLFIFPFFVFGETPRYIIPGLVTSLLHSLGIPRPRTARIKAFLDREPRVSIVVAAHNEEDAACQRSNNRQAAAALVERAQPGDAVLLKGSRGMRLEEVAEIFKAHRES